MYLALVTDCYVVIIVPRHPHPLTSSQRHLSVVLLAPNFVAVQGHRCPGPMCHRCAGAAVANAIAIAIASNCGALVCIGERRPSVGGILDHDGSNGAGPPDNAKLSSPFPPYPRVLQPAYPPSVDGCNDVTQRNPSPERAQLVLILAGAVSYGTVTFQKKTRDLKYW